MAHNGPHERPARMEYEEQMSQTKQAARTFKEHLDGLSNDFGKLDLEDPELTPDMVAGIKKLVFVNAQYKTAVAAMDKVLAQVAAWDSKFFMRIPTGEEEVACNRFYAEASHLLRILEASFNSAVSIPPSIFIDAFNQWATIITEHPELCKAAAVVGGAAGGFLGAGLHGLLGFKHGIVHLGLHAKLQSCGSVGGAVIGGAGGVVVGIMAAGLCLGILVLLQKMWQRAFTDDDVQLRQKMEKQLAELAHKSLDHQAIIDLGNLFNHCYLHPMEAIRNEETCLICFGEFELEPRKMRATKAVNCQGKHWVHEHCSSAWVSASNGDVRCVYCRQ